MPLMATHSTFVTAQTMTKAEPNKIVRILISKFRYYCLSIFDKHHHPDISFDQGLKILRMCTDELKRRLPIDFKGVCFHFAGMGPHMLTMATDVGQSDRQGWHTGDRL